MQHNSSVWWQMPASAFIRYVSFQWHHRAYKLSSLHLLISQKLNWISYTLSASASAAAAQAREKERVARRIMARVQNWQLAQGPPFLTGENLCASARGVGTHPPGEETQPPGADIIPRGWQISISSGPPRVARSKPRIQLAYLPHLPNSPWRYEYCHICKQKGLRISQYLQTERVKNIAIFSNRMGNDIWSLRLI